MMSIVIFLWWWVVLQYGEITYFMVYTIIWLFLYLLLATKTKQIHSLRSVSWKYWLHRSIASFGWISWFLSLIVIKNLWLSISILLWFIWIWVTLFISYLFLWDIPSRKDTKLTIGISLLIALWYYFK